MRTELGAIEELCKARKLRDPLDDDVAMLHPLVAANAGTKRSDDVGDGVAEQPPVKKGVAVGPLPAVSSADFLATASGSKDRLDEKQLKEQEKEVAEKKKELLRQQATEKAKQADMQLQSAE